MPNWQKIKTEFAVMVTMKYCNLSACFFVLYAAVWTTPITFDFGKISLQIKNDLRPFKELWEAAPFVSIAWLIKKTQLAEALPPRHCKIRA